MLKSGPPAQEIEAAAALLAATASCPDGWMSADGSEQLLGLADPVATQAWATRLYALLARYPSLELLHACSERYPRNLRSVEGRPALLFAVGDMSADDEQAVAIVGSRTADAAALEAARVVAGSLATRGLTIVSGLARGIDAAAHRAAVEARGRTIAVMGTGLGRVYPPENKALAESIRLHGVLVSQFPPDHGPTKTTFPARNAVIAGLSKASVVVVAAERSGTSIEITHTLAQGRPVLLWGPTLSSQRWARELGEDPLVDFVESADDIESALAAAA